ncbi:MAG: CHAT domain-containing protein, partial [Desertimonas sp.]
DGPLVVHDVERLARVPDVVVMSACGMANAQALRGGSLLGLAAALTTFGASSVIAPLTPVLDEASVSAMAALHDRMQAGDAPAAALAAITGDGGRATAGAFVAFGA